MIKHIFIGVIAVFAIACSSPEQPSKAEKETIPEFHFSDAHSYAEISKAITKHLNLNILVDFDRKVISGTASYDIEQLSPSGHIKLDIDGLRIEKVLLEDGTETTYTIGAADPHLGQELDIKIPAETKQIHIYYETAIGAKALQWLDPVQTAGKKSPFLFTQSQAILARSWVPCQDGPGVRFTYHAKVKVPEGMLALMSASNPTEKNKEGVYVFDMEQAIPAYLMALTVGDIAFENLGAHTGVYAEPSVLKKAAYEFSETEKMLEAAEALYGKYAWERYDMIVLPPSFPFGGMENPRLTFATPTILAGDRSLTALIAHELAHSWSGNLVTNATWNDFWLNEGFTVYFERRIMEAVEGRDYSEMLAMLGYQDLEEEVKDIGLTAKDTHLELSLKGRNPDDGLTDIAYEKGYFFLRLVEETVGRKDFDHFLKNYFQGNAFTVMTTDKFLWLLEKDLLSKHPGSKEKINVDAWVHGPGIPANCPKVSSDKFVKVDQELAKFMSGTKASGLKTSAWSSHEWLHFLRHIPAEINPAQMKDLDKSFGLTTSGNSEVLAAWFTHTVRRDYKAADKALEDFLITVGRRKFLTPLYKELIAKDPSKARARAIYKKARPNYHSVAKQTMDDLMPQ